MVFKIFVSPRAIKEIYKSINFYEVDSQLVPQNFIIAIENAYAILSQNPYQRIRY